MHGGEAFAEGREYFAFDTVGEGAGQARRRDAALWNGVRVKATGMFMLFWKRRGEVEPLDRLASL